MKTPRFLTWSLCNKSTVFFFICCFIFQWKLLYHVCILVAPDACLCCAYIHFNLLIWQMLLFIAEQIMVTVVPQDFNSDRFWGFDQQTKALTTKLPTPSYFPIFLTGNVLFIMCGILNNNFFVHFVCAIGSKKIKIGSCIYTLIKRSILYFLKSSF